MKQLIKNGTVIHYAKNKNILMDFVDSEKGHEAIWKLSKGIFTSINGLEDKEFDPIYRIETAPKEIVLESIMVLKHVKKSMCWHCNRKTVFNRLDRCTICNLEPFNNISSREEYLSYLIDSMLMLPVKYDSDYSLTFRALKAVAITVNNNPRNYPMTMTLHRFMKEKKMI